MPAECLWEFCRVLAYLCWSKSVVVYFGYMQQQGTNELTYLREPETGNTANTSVTQKAYLMCQPCPAVKRQYRIHTFLPRRDWARRQGRLASA